MRAFIRRYVAAVLLLHQYGETAWPWHVREVWCLVRDAEPGPDSGMAPSEDLPRSAKPADHQPHQSEHPEGPSMRKIPTLFLRDPDDMKRITREVHPDCQWVLDGKGAATRKYDGTCVMLDADGAWWARREVKAGKAGPPNFRAVEYDPATGKTVGWEPIEQSAFAKYHAEALSNPYERHHEGTYELIGPKVNGNPERTAGHELVRHADAEVLDAPRDYDALAAFLKNFDGEGIVWHNPDGRMAKLKRRDYPA